MNRPEKEGQVQQLRNKIDASSVVLLCSCSGVDVPTITAWKQAFRKAGCEYKVFKNTLIRRAIAGTGVAGAGLYLEGPTAVVFGTEHPGAAAKLVRTFSKEKKGFFVKGGWFDGTLLDAKMAEALADMPSVEQIKAHLLSTLMAPATQLVRVLNAGAQEFVYLLEAKKEQNQ